MMPALAVGVSVDLVLAQVGQGRIQGGWGYIWSSYAIAWGSLGLYALSLWLRRPGAAGSPPSVNEKEQAP